MRPRFLPILCVRQSWLSLSLIVFLSNTTASPVQSQTIDFAPPLSRTAPRQILLKVAQPSTKIPLSKQITPIHGWATLRNFLVTPTSQLPLSPPPQDIVPPSDQTLPKPSTPAPLPPPEELLQPQTPSPTTPEPVPDIAPENFTIKRFEVVGSTVFSPEEFNSVLAGFTNRPISFAELFQARSAVTQLYIDRGYITSGALIPPQTLQGGVVTIQVVEGGLEAINVTGTRRLNSDYVRDRLRRASKPLNQKRLLEALQLLQLNPLIQNISAELSSGSRPGTSVLEVQVTEAKTFNTQIVADNGRSPSVGSFRRRAQINEANLLGLGDGLSLVYSNTDGSNGVDASYAFPLNARNGNISFNFGITESNVIEFPFNELDIAGNSRYYELTLRQPLSQTLSEEFALGLTASRRESDISSEVFENVSPPVPASVLSPGADDEGRTRVSALQFFQEWTSRNSREVIAARSQFSLGIGALNATINETSPDSRFFSWRGQAQWVRLLAKETLLLLRADVQLADRALVPLEQFGLGGQESVRGYRQDALLTDNGAFVSAELRLPIYRVPQRGWVLQLTPFVDAGTAWDNSRRNTSSTNISDTNTLVSVGLGLRLQLGDNFTARLDWGIPLVDISSSTERTWQENGLYFSIVSSPF